MYKFSNIEIATMLFQFLLFFNKIDFQKNNFVPPEYNKT